MGKWAMDIFDQEGEEFTSCTSKVVSFGGAAGFPLAANFIRNAMNRTPMRTNMFFATLTIPVWLFISKEYQDWSIRRTTEEDAMLKHYILTNPERFPEPKRVKLIDRVDDWRPIRW